VLTTAPGIRILGDTSQKVHVPRDSDSEWAEFTLQADAPGAGSASVVATLDGTYLGNLPFAFDVRPDTRPGPLRRVRSEVGMESVRGAVSLIARYSPRENLYRFQLITDDYPSEVRYQLEFDPADSIKDLIKVLNDLAEGRRVYSPAKARRFLSNKGMELWQSLLPEVLRDQFWDHQAGIEQLTIVSDNDDLPWEVLYPRDRGHGDQFLVEQFPVTRAIFDRSRVRGLRLSPARFVLPPRSPSKAADEVATLGQLLGETSPDAVVTDYDQLLELLENDDFGVLHFACHNTFDPVAGSAIKFGKTLFTPDDLTMIADDRVLEDSAPLVFVNACQAAGLALSYNKLDGWATKFMAAGAAAFIGTLWAVTDETSTPFAAKVYSELSGGTPLGQAVLAARKAVSEAPADPTWLAYTVYGDPRATITSSEG
jgi:CHAT domain